MKTCPVCIKPITKMVDYPFVLIKKIEFPDQGIINGFNDDNTSCRKIWTELSSLPEIQNYFWYLESCVNKKVAGKTLLPAIKSEGPGGGKLPVSMQEQLRLEKLSKKEQAIAFFEGRPRIYYLDINDSLWIVGQNTNREFIDGHAQVVIWKSGGFSREGLVSNSVGVIADLYYDGTFS